MVRRPGLTAVLLALYTGISSFPFVVAATRQDFWQSQTPLATALVFGLLFALVRRKRWAWWLLILLDVAILVSFPFTPFDPIGLALSAARAALLLSAPVRRHVGVGGRRTHRPASPRSTAH